MYTVTRTRQTSNDRLNASTLSKICGEARCQVRKATSGFGQLRQAPISISYQRNVLRKPLRVYHPPGQADGLPCQENLQKVNLAHKCFRNCCYPKYIPMPAYEKKDLRTAVEEEIFIENIQIRYGVAKPIIRQLIADVGICLPKIYDELRLLGYPVPARTS